MVLIMNATLRTDSKMLNGVVGFRIAPVLSNEKTPAPEMGMAFTQSSLVGGAAIGSFELTKAMKMSAARFMADFVSLDPPGGTGTSAVSRSYAAFV